MLGTRERNLLDLLRRRNGSAGGLCVLGGNTEIGISGSISSVSKASGGVRARWCRHVGRRHLAPLKPLRNDNCSIGQSYAQHNGNNDDQQSRRPCWSRREGGQL